MSPPVGTSPRPIVRDLEHGDLGKLVWSGDPGHLDHMASQLQRVPSGEIEYLVVCLLGSRAAGAGMQGEERLVGKGAIDYSQVPDCGVLTELSVLTEVQSRGLGSLLIRTMEQRIRARNLDRVEIAVEMNNPRAQRLYERLGYQEYDQRPESWTQTTTDGKRYRYHTTCAWLRKNLDNA